MRCTGPCLSFKWWRVRWLFAWLPSSRRYLWQRILPYLWNILRKWSPDSCNSFTGVGLATKSLRRFVRTRTIKWSEIKLTFISITIWIFKSPDVAQAVYSCDWYRMDSKFKLAVLQIIRRSQKPIRYSGGALFQINFHTFITVCAIVLIRLKFDSSDVFVLDSTRIVFVLHAFENVWHWRRLQLKTLQSRFAFIDASQVFIAIGSWKCSEIAYWQMVTKYYYYKWHLKKPFQHDSD